MADKKKTKSKIKKKVSSGVAHVVSSFNNTIITITDENGNCKLYSRMGKEFTTLNKVKEAIEATGIINHVFDGEICLMDENGDEDFQGVMKQLIYIMKRH